MMKNLIIATLVIFPKLSNAFISTDTALMFELVATTASQLNELEQLLTTTEKYTEKMQHYNEIAQDKYLHAQRVQYLAESLAAEKRIENLGEFNGAIRDLKYSIEDMGELLREYRVIQAEEDRTHIVNNEYKMLNEQKLNTARAQVVKSTDKSTSGRENQLTAQNTAMLLETNVQIHNSILDLNQKIATNNRLTSEIIEEQRQDQIKKEEYFRPRSSRFKKGNFINLERTENNKKAKVQIK